MINFCDFLKIFMFVMVMEEKDGVREFEENSEIIFFLIQLSRISNIVIVSLVSSFLYCSILIKVWPITNFFDQQVNIGSKKLVDEHSNKWPSKRILLQVNTALIY